MPPSWHAGLMHLGRVLLVPLAGIALQGSGIKLVYFVQSKIRQDVCQISEEVLVWFVQPGQFTRSRLSCGLWCCTCPRLRGLPLGPGSVWPTISLIRRRSAHMLL